MSDVGKKIRFAREYRGLTRKELASMCKSKTIDYSYIYRWETGLVEPGEESVKRVAAALQVQYPYFSDNNAVENLEPYLYPETKELRMDPVTGKHRLELRDDIGKRIQTAREYRHLTRSDLAVLCRTDAIQYVEVYQWETSFRTPSVEYVKKIARALGIRSEYFFKTNLFVGNERLYYVDSPENVGQYLIETTEEKLKKDPDYLHHQAQEIEKLHDAINHLTDEERKQVFGFIKQLVKKRYDD